MENKEVIHKLIETLPWLVKFFDFVSKYKIEYYGISFALIAFGTYSSIYLFLDILRDVRKIILNKKAKRTNKTYKTNTKRKKKQT